MKRTAAILIALWCSPVPWVNAQDGWLPRTVDMGPNITGQNRAPGIGRLEAIERLFRQIPELAHPDGFEIEPAISGHQRRLGQGESVQPGNVVAYQRELTFFWPTKATDPEHRSASSILIAINANEAQFDRMLDSAGREVYYEGHRVTRVPFATEAYGESTSGTVATGLSPTERSFLAVWLTAGEELPWRQVSRGQYYHTVLVHVEGKRGEKLAELTQYTGKTPFQHWVEEAPRRKQQYEEALQAAAQFQPPVEIARLRKEFEETERAAGEELRKSEKSDRENTRNPYEWGDSLRAELRRMTPAERKLPAIVAQIEGQARASAMGVHLLDRDTVAYGVTRILTQTYEKVDWGALAALLAEPTTRQ